MTYAIRTLQKLSGKTAWSTEATGEFEANIYESQDDGSERLFNSQKFPSYSAAEKWAKKICAE